MEDRKFVFKYCSKRVHYGKSLGGHIRTHMSEHLVQANEERRSNAAILKFDARRKKEKDLRSSGGGSGNLMYGLRESPKKTTRFVHSNATVQMEKFCKECGKVFPSLKALCGHMACHSKKEKGINRFENNFGLSEKQKLVIDSQSDTKTSVPTHPGRSKRMRFKSLSNNDHPISSFVPLANGSSSMSEVEQEQEEVAKCLMMLSKDSSYKGHFALVTESSDNNSIVLEAKSPYVDIKVTNTMNYGKNSMSNAYELVEKKLHKETKLKSTEISYDSDNSDSGYFKYGPKKVDSNNSSDGLLRNEVKSSKVGYMSGFKDYDVESRKMLSRGRSRNNEFKKLTLEDLDNDRKDGALRKFNSRKGSNYDSVGQNLVGASSRKVSNGFTNDQIYEHGGTEWKYKCCTSERDYVSDDSTYESDENSTNTNSYPTPKPQNSRNLYGKKSNKGKKKLKSKKSKEHECPICNKIFRSGQALGGHKRSHFVRGCEENTLVIRPITPSIPCLIDLNLPAPFDE